MSDHLTALEKVTFVINRMRVAGGWDDEEAARQVLAAVGLDDNGQPMRHDEAPPAPELGGK